MNYGVFGNRRNQHDTETKYISEIAPREWFFITFTPVGYMWVYTNHHYRAITDKFVRHGCRVVYRVITEIIYMCYYTSGDPGLYFC